jgi:hypothetical protein
LAPVTRTTLPSNAFAMGPFLPRVLLPSRGSNMRCRARLR